MSKAQTISTSAAGQVSRDGGVSDDKCLLIMLRRRREVTEAGALTTGLFAAIACLEARVPLISAGLVGLAASCACGFAALALITRPRTADPSGPHETVFVP